MAKSPVYVSLDLSTVSNSDEKAVVDKKLLASFFKHFQPASLEELKTELKLRIDDSQSIEEIGDVVDEHLYITKIAANYHKMTTPLIPKNIDTTFG